MTLINIKPCRTTTLSIINDPLLDRFHHHKHCHRSKLASQILNAIYCKTVVHIHIGLVVKDIKGTFHKKLQR